MKKEKDRNFRQVYYYSILPWIALGIEGLVGVLLSFSFQLDWKKDISGFLGLAVFFLMVTFCWGIYWMFKIKKCLQKLDKIDERIEKELKGSNS